MTGGGSVSFGKTATLLMPISARRQLFELPDELATKVSIEFYADPKDAFLKGLVE